MKFQFFGKNMLTCDGEIKYFVKCFRRSTKCVMFQ